MKFGYSRKLERNLLRIWEAATPEDVSAGLSWYRTASAEASKLASKFQVSLAQTAGVIAALSPGREWERNLLDAEEFLGAFRAGHRGRDTLSHVPMGRY